MRPAAPHTAVLMIVEMLALGLLAAPHVSDAQIPDPDSVQLGTLHEIAEGSDPRYAQIRLHEQISELTLESLAAGRRPQVELSALASYQTETTSIPFEALSPSGEASFSAPTPPKDHYEAAAEIRQLLYDGGRIASEERIEHARLVERSADVRSSLYNLRMEINAAFFAVLLHQEQRTQLGVLADDLESRRRLLQAQARNGNALPADEAAVTAELIHVNQRAAASESARRAALRRLELLTMQTFSPGDVLTAPDLEREADALVADVLSVSTSIDHLAEGSGRPEFDRFAGARERARAEAAAAEKAVAPRLVAFVRLAVGRPGFDLFDDTFRPYGIVGLRAQWPVFDWSATAGRAAAMELQADVIAAGEAAFTAGLQRDVLDAAYTIERLEAVLADDGHAVALRERVERTARRQLEEGVLVASDYVERRNDVFEARLQHRMHRVELAEARVRLLTMLGVDIPTGGDGLRETIAPQSSYRAHLLDEQDPDR